MTRKYIPTKTEIQSMPLTVFINVNDVISNNYERVFLYDFDKQIFSNQVM